MAKKKVVKKKKSSKSKEKKEKETVAPLYNFPQYEDPKDVTPLVKVVICLAEPAISLMSTNYNRWKGLKTNSM